MESDPHEPDRNGWHVRREAAGELGVRSRQLLAFKRGPTVDIRLDDLLVEVRGDRVHFGIAGGTEYLSWEEWRDFSLHVEHAIKWIEEHTPEDAGGRTSEMDIDE